MTDKQRYIGQWITIALTMILMLGTVIGSSVVTGERSKENERTNINQEVKITAVREVVSDHSNQLTIIPTMQEDIKEIKLDIKEAREQRSLMLQSLVRIETILEEK